MEILIAVCRFTQKKKKGKKKVIFPRCGVLFRLYWQQQIFRIFMALGVTFPVYVSVGGRRIKL